MPTAHEALLIALNEDRVGVAQHGMRCAGVLLVLLAVQLVAGEVSTGLRFQELAVEPRLRLPERGRWTGHASSETEYPLFAATVQLPSTVPGHPTLNCDLLIPLDAAGQPMATARDIVAVFPWPGDRCLRGGGPGPSLARKQGFSVISLWFPNHGSVPEGDRSGYYIFPASGSGAAWRAAYDAAITIAGLPRLPMFAFGCSAGASAAQQFASACPGLVDGMVLMAGRTFDVQKVYAGPAVLMHSDLDRCAENAGLAAVLTTAGWPPLHRTYPPQWTSSSGSNWGWEHNMNGNAIAVGTAWLGALADMRQREGRVLPLANWPLADGERLPDNIACVAALRKLAPPPVVSVDRESACLTLACGTAPAVTAKGTVLLVDDRVGSGREELLAPAQLFAERGRNCIAISTRSHAAPSVAMLRRAMERHPACRGPFILAVVDPRSPELLKAMSVKDAVGVAILEPNVRLIDDVVRCAQVVSRRMALVTRASFAVTLDRPPPGLLVQTHDDDAGEGAVLSSWVEAIGRLAP